MQPSTNFTVEELYNASNTGNREHWPGEAQHQAGVEIQNANLIA
jgi:hypothetical protein